MYKLSLWCLLVISCLFGNAQGTPQANLLKLIDDAQNEFVLTQGQLDHEDADKNLVFYTAKIGLGATAEMVVVNTKDNYKYFSCYFDIDDSDESIDPSSVTLNTWLEVVRVLMKSDKYVAREFTTPKGEEKVEVMDKAGNFILDITRNAKTLKMLVYAKSWGRR